MQAFTYSYPTKVYFGEGAAASALAQELPKAGRTVLLAYGGGSIKRSGIYDQLKGLLEQAGKEVVEFSGIMANPTYAKAQEGVALARRRHVDFILAVGGGSVIDCCKVIAAQAVLEEDIWQMEYQEGRMPSGGIPMGAVIPGLYVCGNVQGSRYAVEYPICLRGISHSLCVYYGYVAGKNCVAGV